MRAVDVETRASRWATPGIAVLLVAAVGVATTYTPLFAARTIRVDAAGAIPRGRVLSLAGLHEGSNVFHLDPARVEERVEADPRVLEATVTTSLPDRISIRIVPRVPVATVGTPPALVGADGIVIGAAGARDHGLPLLRSGDGGVVTGSSLRAAAAAAGALGAVARGLVESVIVRADGHLEARLAAGFSVYLGDAVDLEAKASSLEALLDWAEREEERIVAADLAVPSSPTAQLGRGSAAVDVPEPPPDP